MMHPLVNRTSPTGPGQPFIGTCAACGMKGLTKETMHGECENPRGMTNDDALIEAVEGTDRALAAAGQPQGSGK